jgi:predicted NBD/HSP70 family sugar kinase
LITQITKDLLAQGLLTELELSPSRGGRPARLLGLAVDAGGALGVKVATDHITLVECQIDGTVLRSATEPFDATSSDALEDLVALIRVFIADSARTSLLGIGVATPGNVKEQSVGTVESTQMGWSQVQLGTRLRQEFDLPVLVDNNVNALATAEILFGQAKGHDDALVVTIGTGIGAGIIADSMVLRGRNGIAGEIGHLPTLEDGPLCQCGARGCLEALIGEQALVDQARKQGVLTAREGIDALRDRADSGDAGAQGVFAGAGHILGRALAGVVNLLDPEVLIISGEGVASWKHWMYRFEPAFRACLIPAKRGVPVAVEAWADDRWAQGAACLVLGTPFDEQGRSGAQGEWVRQRLSDTTKPQTPEAHTAIAQTPRSQVSAQAQPDNAQAVK